MDSIEFSHHELSVAEQWHGGQTSMLYAITSTGSLKRGTNRPRNDDGTPMSDAEWLIRLASRLGDEAEACASDARERVKRAKHARRRLEVKEMTVHADALDSIAAKCREAIESLGGVS